MSSFIKEISTNNIDSRIRNKGHECSNTCPNRKCRGHTQHIDTDKQTNQIEWVVDKESCKDCCKCFFMNCSALRTHSAPLVSLDWLC